MEFIGQHVLEELTEQYQLFHIVFVDGAVQSDVEVGMLLANGFQALDELEKVERKVNGAKALLAEHAKGVEFLILDDQQVVKMGKNSVKKAARLPRGVKIV